MTFAKAACKLAGMRVPLNAVRDAIVVTYPKGANRSRWLRMLWRLALKDRALMRRGGDPREYDVALRMVAGDMARDLTVSGPSICGSSNSSTSKAGPMTSMVLGSTITCPTCGHAQRETMPTDACIYFYDCAGCGVVLRRKAGDCCVFCSYGSVSCPPKQAERPCCGEVPDH